MECNIDKLSAIDRQFVSLSISLSLSNLSAYVKRMAGDHKLPFVNLRYSRATTGQKQQPLEAADSKKKEDGPISHRWCTHLSSFSLSLNTVFSLLSFSFIISMSRLSRQRRRIVSVSRDMACCSGCPGCLLGGLRLLRLLIVGLARRVRRGWRDRRNSVRRRASHALSGACGRVLYPVELMRARAEEYECASNRGMYEMMAI